MSPTAPVPEPSSSTDRRLRAWAPSPENPGVSRYLERTMAASQTTQPTPPEPYCCSRNTVPSRFSKTRTKFRSGSSADSKEAAIAAGQQDEAHAVTSQPHAPPQDRPEEGPAPPSGEVDTIAHVQKYRAEKAALPGRGRAPGHTLLGVGQAHSSKFSLALQSGSLLHSSRQS